VKEQSVKQSVHNTNPSVKSEPVTDELVCDLCFNRDAADEKRYLDKLRSSHDPNGNVISFNEKMKLENEKLIREKIKEREKRSEIASNSVLNMTDKNKDKLIDKNIQDKSLLSDLGRNHDPLYEKTNKKYMENEYLQQNYLSRFVSNEKPDVRDFYEKYVDNYKPEERKEYERNKNPHYMDDLREQMERKKLEEQRRKMFDRSFALEQNMKNKEKMDEDHHRRLENDKRLKEGLLNENMYLIEAKKRNKDYDSALRRQFELDNIKKNNETIVKDEEDKRMKKDNYLTKVRQDLLKQIDEKKMMKQSQKELDKSAYYEYKDPHVYACAHGSGLHPCSLCNRKYPIKMLTKRAVSQGKILRKKQFKI